MKLYLQNLVYGHKYSWRIASPRRVVDVICTEDLSSEVREVRSQGSLLEVIDIGGRGTKRPDALPHRMANKTATFSLYGHYLVIVFQTGVRFVFLLRFAHNYHLVYHCLNFTFSEFNVSFRKEEREFCALFRIREFSDRSEMFVRSPDVLL